jgi:hypothetical protein
MFMGIMSKPTKGQKMEKFRIYKGRKINPEWQKHADMYNEGAEGYNPHTQWISEYEFVPTRQIGSKTYSYADAKHVLKRLKDSQPNLPKEKIQGSKDLIQMFEASLGEGE